MPHPYKALAIGASAGAVEALSVLLSALPANYPLAIIIVVHIVADRKNMIPELLQKKCGIKICEAEDKMPIMPGTAYFAPPDYHLLIESDFRLSLSGEEQVKFSRPSVDVMFESAADAYGDKLIGLVLTGANDDGAAGLKAIAEKGGLVIIEDPESAYCAAMPSAALNMCPTAKVLAIAELAEFLSKVAC